MFLTLAITTIGDLLLENRISRRVPEGNIDGVTLCIPNYQRPYKWTVRNVFRLVDDIIEAKYENQKTYRVGTLILHNNQGKYDIVDGQQRVISFCLLLKAMASKLNEKASENGNNANRPPDPSKLNEKASDAFTENGNNANRPPDPSKLNEKASGAFKEPEFLKRPIEPNPYTVRNLVDNYLALCRKIGNIPKPELEQFWEYVTKQCELVVVITKDLSEAFQLFDSQNSRGKKLYPHDLLKAYHLREMNLSAEETERVVEGWEELDQNKLSSLFGEYLYCLKEWINGNWAGELSEHNIDKFKGITRRDNFPCAQFFKGAFAFNHSAMLFVSGMGDFNPFQIAAPIIAGKPFFDYTKHYYSILEDIQNIEGKYIDGNEIVKTLEQPVWKNGTGNEYVRFLFDTAILLYVDRFCPENLSDNDRAMLEQFIVYAFIWAYSLRWEYDNLYWSSAQNYIMEKSGIRNELNIYKEIVAANSPSDLQSTLANKLKILDSYPDEIKKYKKVRDHYLYYFNEHHFLPPENQNEQSTK